MSDPRITPTTDLGELVKAMAWVDDVEPSEIAVEIAQDRRCDRRPFCRHMLGVFERLEKCDCLATADRRLRHQELESTK